MNAELLFVTGHPKTGTSTVLGMLNSHPDIFLLYEVNLTRPEPSGRGRQFLEKFPALHSSERPALGTWEARYRELERALWQAGFRYRFLGDKILSTSLPPGQLPTLAEHRVIFVVRNIRTWLCKNVVVDDVLKDRSLRDVTLAYVADFLTSFRFPRCVRVRMEDVIHENGAVLAKLGDFLAIDLQASASAWWDQVGRYPADDPKAILRWWDGHDSSRLKPRKEDTKVQLRSHPFWDVLLPVFDKYFNGVDQSYPPEEIDADHETLRTKLPAGVSLQDLYESASSVSFGSGVLGTFGHRSSNPHTKPFKL